MGTRVKQYIIYTLQLLGLSLSLFAQQPGKNNLEDLDATLRQGQLGNGFTYYLKQNTEPAGRVEIIFSVKAGYYQQDERQTEYAHLLEHMGTFHTGRYPELRKFTDSLGIYNYARTGYDNTMYTITLPSDDKEKMNAALDIVYEWADNILLREKDIKVQSGAVIGEGRSKDPYQEWLLDTLSNIVLSNTKTDLIDRAKILRSMRNVDLKALTDFKNKWYRPDLEAVIIVGDIKLDSLERVVRGQFKDLKKGTCADNPEGYNKKNKVEPDGINQYHIVQDSTDKSPRVIIIKRQLNHERYVQSEKDLKQMLWQELSLNLLQEQGKYLTMQYDPPFDSYTNSFRSNTIADGQLQTSYFQVFLEEPFSIKQKMIQLFEAEQSMKNNLDGELLDQVKDNIFRELTAKNNNSYSIAKRLHRNFINGNISWTPEKYKHKLKEILDGIELSDLKKYINNQWDYSANTDFIFFNIPPSRLPNHKDMMKWYQEGKKLAARKRPFVLNKIDSIPNRFSPVVTKSSELPDENVIGIRKVTLSNGIKLIFKPSEPAIKNYENRVSMNGYKEIPLTLDDPAAYLAISHAPNLMFYGDVGDYSKFEIAEFMLVHDMNLTYRTAKNQFLIEGGFRSPEFRQFINLFYLYLAKPKYNMKAFELWKNKQKDQVDNKYYDVMRKELIERFRYTELPGLTSEHIEEITYKEYKRAYQKFFANLNGFTFIFTGDFNSEKFIPEVMHYFSEIQTFPIEDQKVSETYAYNFKKFHETVECKNTNQAIVELSFPIEVIRNPENQVLLDLLSYRLNEMIFDRLRVGSYTPYAQGEWVDPAHNIYAFNISFDSELGNQDRMIEYALEEFRKLRKNGITSDWLETTISHKLSKYGRGLETFWLLNMWPDFLKIYERNENEGVKIVLEYETILGHFVKVADVNKAAKKYLSEEKRQDLIIIPGK